MNSTLPFENSVMLTRVLRAHISIVHTLGNKWTVCFNTELIQRRVNLKTFKNNCYPSFIFFGYSCRYFMWPGDINVLCSFNLNTCFSITEKIKTASQTLFIYQPKMRQPKLWLYIFLTNVFVYCTIIDINRLHIPIVSFK